MKTQAEIEAGHYEVWRAHFGQSVGSGASVSASSAVPESATPVMLIFAAASLCLRRGYAG